MVTNLSPRREPAAGLGSGHAGPRGPFGGFGRRRDGSRAFGGSGRGQRQWKNGCDCDCVPKRRSCPTNCQQFRAKQAFAVDDIPQRTGPHGAPTSRSTWRAPFGMAMSARRASHGSEWEVKVFVEYVSMDGNSSGVATALYCQFPRYDLPCRTYAPHQRRDILFLGIHRRLNLIFYVLFVI